MKKGQIVNIPNILALIRLLLVPVVFILILNDRFVIALLMFVLACLTDLADGYIARRFDLITQVGTFLDPLADKCMAVLVIVAFTIKGVLPVWVTVVIFTKEILMLIGGILVAKHTKKIPPSNGFGKIAAFVFNTSIATCFLNEYLYPYNRWFLYLALAGSVSSLIQYAWRNREDILRKKGCEEEE